MNNIPNEVLEYVSDFMADYEYADNVRIMRSTDSDLEYERIRGRGCCGFVDYQTFVWQGVEYWFGFNYGH
jgi:hypothetical protein